MSQVEIGQRFGRLVVKKRHGSERTPNGCSFSTWEVRCDCGKQFVVRGASLASGNTISCGCVKVEHDRHPFDVYKIWVQIKQRCTNPRAKDFKNYGGRGIMMCQEWMDSYPTFLAAIGPRPSKKYTVGRIENSRGYEPGNVEWQTMKVQGNNRRNNRVLHFSGRSLTVSAWSDVVGIPAVTLYDRLRNGWSTARALTQQVARR
jgi:hypothetical protein